MKINSISANLMVKNVNETVAFYKKHFGFEFFLDVPEGDGEKNFAIVKFGKILLMFQEERNFKQECPFMKRFSPGDAAFTLYIDVDDVKVLYEKVKGKLKLVQDLHTTFYGSTEFGVFDCNGYVLWFAQQDTN